MSERTMAEQRRVAAPSAATRAASFGQMNGLQPRGDMTASARDERTGPSLPAASPGLAHGFGGVQVFPESANKTSGRGQAARAGAAAPQSFRWPRIAVKQFSPDSAGSCAGAGLSPSRSTKPDKSESLVSEMQDQSASLTTLEATARGVHIEVEVENGFSSDEFPDGFKWTQTIDTNVPLGGTTSPYVDPRPNDDTRPFYWTAAEEVTHPTTFIDFPSRNPPATGVTTWEAILALNGVNESTKTVTAFDALTYGFTRDSAGTVTVLGPSSIGFSGHQAILASEFPSWTFS